MRRICFCFWPFLFHFKVHIYSPCTHSKNVSPATFGRGMTCHSLYCILHTVRSFILYVTHCISYMTSYILPLIHCILNIASYTLYITHCILHIASYTLHLTHCILHIASYTLHLKHCILHIAS